ncbi:MAG: DUF7019 family protein, partial [Actinomycetes bacterium]
DMLLPQVDPAFTRTRSSEAQFNLKIFSAKRAVSSADVDRTARLERVIRHLEDHGALGTVDEPRQFFWGSLAVQWGPFAADPALVYFGGRTAHTILGLGGSSSHVLGPALDPAHDQGLRYSLTPWMLNGLAADPEIKTLLETGKGRPERAALEAVELANDSLRGPEQKVEFVAKRLPHGPSPYSGSPVGMSVLLGSPLYVALVD